MQIQIILLSSLLSSTLSAVCSIQNKDVVYDCADIKVQADCKGSKGGVPCVWQSNACTYQTCEMLDPSKCSGSFLQGKQCFLNAQGSCTGCYLKVTVGASGCSSYDSNKTCINYRNQICYWDQSSSVGQCVVSSCPQITDPFVCMNTTIADLKCSWYGNIANDAKCQVASCSYRSPDFCDGKMAGDAFCKADNVLGCRSKVCSDFTDTNQATDSCNAGTAQIATNIYCLNQSSSASGSASCGAVQDCSDIMSQKFCEKGIIANVSCIWSTSSSGVSTCRRKTCADLKTCSGSVNGVKCVNDSSSCTSCSQLQDPCNCLSNSKCIYTYSISNGAQTCVDKICSSFVDSDSCTTNKCFWNKDTTVCGDTQASTGFVQNSNFTKPSTTATNSSTTTSSTTSGTSTDNTNESGSSQGYIISICLVLLTQIVI